MRPVYTAAVSIAILLVSAPTRSQTSGETFVSGEITTQTWTKENSPYRVTGEILVPWPEKLTIGPGVDVLFDEPVEFRVQGLIDALGTATDSIRFLPGDTTHWGGMRIVDASCADPCPRQRETVRFEFVRISGVVNTWGGFVIRDNASLTVPGLSMRDCVISHNRGTENIGGILAGVSGMEFVRCTVAYNSTPGWGGGILLVTTADRIDSCVIVHNTAGEYGGIGSLGAFSMRHNTLSGNVPEDIALQDARVASHIISWGAGAEIAGDDPPSITYSLIEGGYPGEGNIDADPEFVDAAGGDFRLRETSPCIDAGDPDAPPDPDGTRSDIGAYYYDQSTNPVLPTPLRVTQFRSLYPNPFNPRVTVRYSLAGDAPVSLTIYDVLGRPVRTLVDGMGVEGEHTAVWEGLDGVGRSCASGVYVVRLAHGGVRQVRRVVLVR